jgi:hypothetical protein
MICMVYHEFQTGVHLTTPVFKFYHNYYYPLVKLVHMHETTLYPPIIRTQLQVTLSLECLYCEYMQVIINFKKLKNKLSLLLHHLIILHSDAGVKINPLKIEFLPNNI